MGGVKSKLKLTQSSRAGSRTELGNSIYECKQNIITVVTEDTEVVRVGLFITLQTALCIDSNIHNY